MDLRPPPLDRDAFAAIQLPAGSLAHEHWDVAVVGAGPAGATTALHLARMGHRVALVDAHPFPREKVCGDGLIADSLGALARAGLATEVHARGHRLETMAAFSPRRHRVDVAGTFVTLRRRELDAVLARAAHAAGATFAQGTVRAVEETAEAVLLHLAGHTIQARFAVLATGADQRLLGRSRGRRPPPSALAVRCYVRSPVELDHLVISLDRSVLPGYAWIFPLGDGWHNLGAGVFRRGGGDRRHPRSAHERFVAAFPLARELMASASEVTPLRGAALRCGLTAGDAVVGPRTLAVGETIATTFHLSGEGIGKAMETGEVAARTLAEALTSGTLEAPHGFSHRLHRALADRYRGYEIAEGWLARPWFLDLVAWLGARSPRVRRGLAGVIDESIDLERLFSRAGLRGAMTGTRPWRRPPVSAVAVATDAADR